MEMNAELATKHASKQIRNIHNYEGLYMMRKSGEIISLRPGYDSPIQDSEGFVTLYDMKGTPTRFNYLRLVSKTWHPSHANYLKTVSKTPFMSGENDVYQEGVFAKQETDFESKDRFDISEVNYARTIK